MSGRIAVVLAGVLLAGATVLALAAHDVEAWARIVRQDDVRFVTAPTAPKMWEPDATPGMRRMSGLLGIDDDLRFRRAERLYVQGHLPATTFAGEKARLAARGLAVELLDSIATRDELPWRRARAANLLGILVLEDAREGRELAPALTRQALRAFRLGARQQEGADEARFNLEVLLTALRPDGLVGRDLSQNQAGVASGRGAGLALPEKGY